MRRFPRGAARGRCRVRSQERGRSYGAADELAPRRAARPCLRAARYLYISVVAARRQARRYPELLMPD